MLHVHRVIMCNYAMEGIVLDQVSYALFSYFFFIKISSLSKMKWWIRIYSEPIFILESEKDSTKLHNKLLLKIRPLLLIRGTLETRHTQVRFSYTFA